MNWLDTAAKWFIGLATSPAAPYLLVSLIAFAFAILVLAIRVWLDVQETKVLADYQGHVPPRPWPADFVDTQPAGIEPDSAWPRARPALTNPVQRPLHTAQIPPAKECCGACDGSKCDTDPYRQVAERTQADVITAVTMPRPARAQVPPRRNPTQPSGSYLGSYYGPEIDRILNSESPAPVADDKQGREFQ